MNRFAGTTTLAYARCDSCTFLKNGFFAAPSFAIVSQVLRNSIFHRRKHGPESYATPIPPSAGQDVARAVTTGRRGFG